MQGSTVSAIARFCGPTGINRLCKPVYGGLGLILMFHRFTEKPNERVDICGVIDREFFETLLKVIRTNGDRIIPLRDVPQAIRERQPFVCLTIDDGYRDNMEVALPILRRYNAPATIFVPSGVLDRSLDPWWLQVEEIAKLRKDPQIAYTTTIREMETSPENFKRIQENFTKSPRELVDRYFLNAGEVRAIAKEPLIDIGGHTITHQRLAEMDEITAYREIVQNKKDLEELLGKPVETFAYPYGNAQACGPREYSLARKAGYKVAVTTRDGNIFPGHEDHLTSLPRYAVRGEFENIAIFEMQRSGTYHALRSRFGSPLVTG